MTVFCSEERDVSRRLFLGVAVEIRDIAFYWPIAGFTRSTNTPSKAKDIAFIPVPSTVFDTSACTRVHFLVSCLAR